MYLFVGGEKFNIPPSSRKIMFFSLFSNISKQSQIVEFTFPEESADVNGLRYENRFWMINEGRDLCFGYGTKLFDVVRSTKN